MRERRYYLLSALGCGLLLTLAWPCIGSITPLLFLAWVPLLLAEKRFTESPADGRPRNFFPYVLLAVAVWNAGCTWWLFCVREEMGTKLFTVIGPNIGNDLLMCVPWMLMRWSRRMIPGYRAQWALPLYWIAFERFHMHWDLSWPWLTLGNAFANNTPWVQWYEWTGALGGSLWVWLANLLIARWWSGRDRRYALFACLVISVPVALSWLRYITFEEQGVPTEVVVVQPNVDPYTEKFANGQALEQLDRMLQQAEALVSDPTALVVFPETALQETPVLGGTSDRLEFSGLWENDLEGAQSVHHIRRFLVHHRGAALVTGMSSSYLFPPGAELPVTARMMEGLDRGFDAYNAALLVRPDGSTGTYHKSKLVPGVELLPFESVIGPLAGAVALDLGGTTGSLGVQEEREVMRAPGHDLAFAPIICYESIYGDHVAAHVRNGATLLVIMTNDAWWDDSPGYKQHLAYGRLRAIETRRSVARSANTGISCFIDQRGDLHDATDWWVPAVARRSLLARSDMTFFTRTGDIIGIGAEVLSTAVLLVIAALLLRRRLARV